MSLKKFRVIYLAIAILLFLILFFYIREERFIAQFRSGLEKLLSEAVGYQVAIGDIGGNIFKKVVLYDLSCKVGDYTLGFDRVQMGYSLWEVISEGKIKDSLNNNVIELLNGSLKFKDNRIISEKINGKIRLQTHKIVIEGLDFELLPFLNNHLRGEIIREAEVKRLNLRLESKPFFDRQNLFFSPLETEQKQKRYHKFLMGFKEAALAIEGPLGSLSFNGRIATAGDSEILLNGRCVFEEEILRFNSRLDLKDLKAEKASAFFAEAEINLEGSRFKAAVTPGAGRVIINGDYSEWPLLKADIANDHIRIGDLDFSNIIHLTSNLIYKSGVFSHLALDIYTESTILNYYPFDEFEISCWVDESLLRLIYLKAGDSISASGVLSLEPPHRVFFKLNLADFDISRLLVISKEQDEPVASGKMSGEATMEGSLDELKTKANFGAKLGHIGTIDYKNMMLNMEGQGPILTIYDSRLIRENSFLTIEGMVDIRKLGKERFLENLKISTDPHTIIWDGWDISKAAGQNELRLSKGVQGGVKVGFKKHISNDETAYQSIKPQDELELEYRMPDDESSLQFKAKEKEEFLGLRRIYKF